MRKNSLAALAGMFLVLTSCNNSADTKMASANDSSQTEKNIHASQVIWSAFETGDANKLDSVVAPDFLDHTDMGDKKGIDSLKSVVHWLHTNIQNMKMERKKQWADDEYTNEWVHYTGDMPVAMGGMPAGHFDIKAIELTRYSDGKAVEHWFFYDSQTMADMMKNMQGMGGTMNEGKMRTDSSKMKSK